MRAAARLAAGIAGTAWLVAAAAAPGLAREWRDAPGVAVFRGGGCEHCAARDSAAGGDTGPAVIVTAPASDDRPAGRRRAEPVMWPRDGVVLECAPARRLPVSPARSFVLRPTRP